MIRLLNFCKRTTHALLVKLFIEHEDRYLSFIKVEFELNDGLNDLLLLLDWSIFKFQLNFFQWNTTSKISEYVFICK